MSNKSFNELLKNTIGKTEKLIPNDKPFRIENLFDSEEWESLPRGTRRVLGKKYKKWVAENGGNVVTHYKVETDNSNWYKRV